MARFLTANFFHMSLTAIAADALFTFIEAPEERASDLSRTMLFVVGMHGGYDFLLSNRSFGDLSFFAMTVFVLLARRFLSAVSAARGRVRSSRSLLNTFIVAVSVVVGTSYVYAAAEVGPAVATVVMAEGLLGVAIIAYMFIRELRDV
jgi:hypothetical protein